MSFSLRPFMALLPVSLSRLCRALWALLLLPILTSCYVPNDFVAEIRLSQAGDYSIVYKGNLTWAPLYREIRQGKLTAGEIADKEAVLIRDLSRDTSFSNITALGSGTFHVAYERTGHFTGTQSLTFVRRSAALLTMALKPDGTVHIWASQDPKLRDPAQLETLGLRTQGRLRVITDAPVLSHNAYRVINGLAHYPNYRIYDWSINSVRTPKPRLIARLFDPQNMKQTEKK